MPKPLLSVVLIQIFPTIIVDHEAPCPFPNKLNPPIASKAAFAIPIELKEGQSLLFLLFKVTSKLSFIPKVQLS